MPEPTDEYQMQFNKIINAISAWEAKNPNPTQHESTKNKRTVNGITSVLGWEELSRIYGRNRIHRGWLNDNCIMTYLNLLRIHREGVFALDPILREQLRKGTLRPKDRTFAKQAPKESEVPNLKYILIAKHHQAHWTLGVANIVERRFELYNSAHGQPGGLQELQARIEEFQVCTRDKIAIVI